MNWKAFTLLVPLIAISCKGSGSEPTGELPDLLLDVGSTSVYSWSFTTVDSLGNTLSVWTDTLAVRVVASGDSVGTEAGLFRLVAFSVPRNVGSTTVWYKKTGTQFVEIAYCVHGPSMALPKRAKELRPALGSHAALSIETPQTVRRLQGEHVIVDSVIMRTDPRVVYEFPLTTGKTWTSFQDPFLQTREVSGSQMMRRNGSVYYCSVIRTRLPDLAPAIDWFDYVDSKGLVERSIVQPHVPLTSENSPDSVIGWITVRESLQLMSRSASSQGVQ